MPFTFSHPAIVLPLVRLLKKYVSLTGLVIGSMTPDFEYCIRMKVQSDHSHTLHGMLWVDLPLGVLLCFIFHRIVRDPLFDHLPRVLRSRLELYKEFNWNAYFRRRWPVVVISILAGALSHIAGMGLRTIAAILCGRSRF